MTLLPKQCDFSKRLAVECLILLDGSNLSLDCRPPGHKQVVDQVVHTAYIAIGILDILLVADSEAEMLVRPGLEIKIQFIELLTQIGNLN